MVIFGESSLLGMNYSTRDGVCSTQRQRDFYSESVPCSFAAHHGDSMSVRTSILPKQADEL